VSLDPSARVALIVEDDDGLRRTVVGLLQDEGFEIETANTLSRARYILFESRHPVGVVVLDLQLADGDGAPLLRELEAEGTASPAVVITSAFANRAVPLAEEYAVAHVVKPFDVAVLAATVTVAFEQCMRPRSSSTQPTRRGRPV
jgi:DNA-binding NtrC family response regulator